MANRTRSKKRSKSNKMYRQIGGVFTQGQILSFDQEIPEAAINAWSNSNIDYNFFPQAIQQFNDAIQQSTQAIETFRANYIQNIIDIADKIRQDTPMDINELMIQIVSPPGSPVSVASSRMNEGGRRRKTRQSKKVRKSKKSRKTRKQRGGANFSEAQRQELLDQGFTEDNIETLIQEFPNTDAGDVMDSIQQLLSQNNTPQEIIDNLNNDNENNLSGIASSANGSKNNISVGSLVLGDENENDVSGIDDDGSQHNISVDSFEDEDEDNNLNNNIDDISDDSIISNKGDTTREEDSSYMDDIGEHEGGRRRKTRKGRKGKKSRKSRKMRGGMRYGTGVGSNCFEPNFSIYNTPTLSLFPYKPN
jgi:hypothetical protein